MPEFSSEKDDVIERHIEACEPFFDESRWEDYLSRGLAFLAAHFIVTEKQRQEFGAKALAGNTALASRESATVRGSQNAVAIDLQMKHPIMRTMYGQEYFALANQVGMGGIAV